MKVSIIIPYNIDRGYLRQAVESAKNQDDFILGKDYEIVEQFGNLGTSENINKALLRCGGDYIKLFADDDMLLPNCLIDLYTGIKQQKVAFVCANSYIITPNGKKQTHNSSVLNLGKHDKESTQERINQLVQLNTLHGGTMLYRKDIIFEVGGFDEALQFGEEYDLNLNLLSCGYKLGYVDKFVYLYRLHDSNKSTTVNAARRLETLQKIKQRYYETG